MSRTWEFRISAVCLVLWCEMGYFGVRVLVRPVEVVCSGFRTKEEVPTVYSTELKVKGFWKGSGFGV